MKSPLTRATAAAALALFVSASVPGGEPPTYSMEFLGGGFPTAVNNSGEVVGFGLGSPGSAWFADTAGNVVPLPSPPDAIETKANDINEAGLIVGTATLPDGTPRACAWTLVEGTWQVELLESLPVSFGSYGTAVNDLGDIVGTNIGALGSRAVLFNGPEGAVDLYALGLTKVPGDINNARQVLGEQLVLDLDDETVIDIGVPAGGYLWSLGRSMNDSGQISSRTVTASGSFYPVAAKYDPETGWQVLSGPATGNTAFDINEHGDVLIFIQSSWGQQPYLHLEDGGTHRVQDLLDPSLQFWYTENVGAMAMNDHLQIALVVSNAQSGVQGAALLTPMTPPCPADVTGDGVVNVVDLVEVIVHWGEPGGPADVDGSGTVDVQDLVAVILEWGSCG